MARTEDHVIMRILLTINRMQEKIDSIMMKLGLDKGSEAVVIIPQVKRPKKTFVSRSASSFNEETSQTSSISANDSAMVCMLTSSLPTYDSRGEPQKLYEFIQKHDDFFNVVELTPSLVLVLALAKLNGPAYLWWCDHISKYLKSDEGRMKMWEDLKKGLVATFIPLESEIVLLNQLKTLRQNSMMVTDFNAKFNQLTMQVDLCPMEEISQIGRASCR